MSCTCSHEDAVRPHRNMVTAGGGQTYLSLTLVRGLPPPMVEKDRSLPPGEVGAAVDSTERFMEPGDSCVFFGVRGERSEGPSRVWLFA